MRLFSGTRWLALAAFALVWWALTAADVNAHVYGNKKLVPELQVALDRSATPHLDHVRVIAKAPAGCAGSAGCTSSAGDPWVYINLDQSTFDRRLTFYHEVGHQWDFLNYGDDEHAVLTPLVSAGPSTWWGDPPPGEAWAEAYGWCSEGRKPRWNESTAYGWHPTTPEHDAVCAAIAAVG